MNAASITMDWVALLATKGSLLLILAILVSRSLHRVSAAGRHLVWLIALASLLCLPIVASLLPEITLAWLPTAETSIDRAASASDSRSSEKIATPPARAAEMSSSMTSASSLTTWVLDTWTAGMRSGLLTTIWLVGAGFLLLRLGVGLVRLRRLQMAAHRYESPHLQPILETVGERLAPGRRVDVLCHPLIEAPCTWGWHRPVVLLPREATSWGREPLQDVMAHELAHVGRRDWLGYLLASLATALCWFHPLVWLAASRLRLEAERACDDRVLALGTSAPDYAERLLHMAQQLRQLGRRQALLTLAGGSPTGSALKMARRHQLSHRIAAILNPRLRRHTMTRSFFGIASILTLALLCVIAPSTLVHAGSYEELSSPSKGLVDAAADGDLARVLELLEQGADANARLAGEGSPLILASHHGHHEVVRALLVAGADPNLVESKGPRKLARTALNAAARSGSTQTIHLLLEAGADVDAAPRGDATPLMTAASRGDDAIAEILLTAGADADRRISGDGSPLILAANSGDAQLVERLLAAGADPNAKVRGDGNPLIQAARRGNTQVVERLLAAGANPNASVRGDGNPMIAASRGGHRDIVKMLIDAGAKIDQGVAGDGNALIRAAGKGDINTVFTLLSAGADPNAAVEGDGNALIMAARGGHTPLVSLLLEHGAEIDAVVPGDENALIRASGNGHLGTVQLLIDQGADVNRQVPVNSWRGGREIRSPLSMARQGGHDEVVELLVRNGARS